MSGWHTYTRFQRIEAQAKQLGFRLGKPGKGYSHRDYGDMISLYPDGQALPIYSRDAELFIGTFDQIEDFLMGWAKAQQYDHLLRLTDDKKRKKYEDKEVERQRLAKEREEKKKMWVILNNQLDHKITNPV